MIRWAYVRNHDRCGHSGYQLTCHEYDELRNRASGRCEICQLPEDETCQRRLVIDHDHGLGIWAVRGLLCDRCNAMLDYPGLLVGPGVERYRAAPWRTTQPVWPPPLSGAAERALAELVEVAAARGGQAGRAGEVERAAIVAAWRAGVPPTLITEAAQRSAAHVRKLRPADVPPARLGGGAALEFSEGN